MTLHAYAHFLALRIVEATCWLPVLISGFNDPKLQLRPVTIVIGLRISLRINQQVEMAGLDTGFGFLQAVGNQFLLIPVDLLY